MNADEHTRPHPGSLAGMGVVVTRATHQSAGLNQLLQQAGAQTINYPCLAIVPPLDTAPLDNALRAAGAGFYTWLLITSQNVVQALAERLEKLSLTLAQPPLQIAAVGSRTAAHTQTQLQLSVDLIPTKFTGESLVARMALTTTDKVLLPQTNLAPSTVADQVAATGAHVDRVEAYRSVRGQGGENLPALFAAGKVDIITFTSAATVRFFLERWSAEGGQRQDLDKVALAAIGPTTATAMRVAGLRVDIMPSTYTMAGLVAACEAAGNTLKGRV